MKIVAIANVKNESDIVEPFVRHTLELVDQLVVLDNGSSDGTLEILHALRQEGRPLEIVEDPSLGQYQSRRTTRLMHDYAIRRCRADWVLPLDADLFLKVPDSGCVVPPTAVPDKPIALAWHSYMPAPDDDLAERNPVLRMSHRVRQGSPAQTVVIPHNLAARPTASIQQGNHELWVDNQPVESIHSQHACLAHFPIRSPGQYLVKVAISALQYRSMSDRNWEWGGHYREAFELLKSDPRAFFASYTAAAREYMVPAGAAFDGTPVNDPLVYRGGPLRYSHGEPDEARAWRAILHYTEQLAFQHASLVGERSEHTSCSKQEIDDATALPRQLEQQAKVLQDQTRQLVEKERVIQQLKRQLLQQEHPGHGRRGTFVRRWQSRLQKAGRRLATKWERLTHR